MKFLQGLSHDTKPLSCSTGNRAKVLLKCHLSIKCFLQYNKVRVSCALRVIKSKSIKSKLCIASTVCAGACYSWCFGCS